MTDARKEVRDSLLSLQIPPDPGHLSTARLFAASIARHYGLDEDAVDDLKVALSEACNSAIGVREAASSDSSIEISASVDGERLTFEIEDGGAGLGSQAVDTRGRDQMPEPPADEVARALGLSLIQALFPEADTPGNDRGGINIRFSLEIPASN